MNIEQKKNIFRVAYPKAPQGLLDQVMGTVEEAILAQEGKKHLVILSFFSFLSFSAAAYSLYRTQASFSESGLSQFASLLFSDFGVVAAYWKSFLFSLLERMPLNGLIALSGSSFIFFITLKALARDVKKVMSFSVHHKLIIGK